MNEEMTTIQNTIIEGYVDEFYEHLGDLEKDILSLEENSEAINNIFCTIHSLKGSAGMLGFINLNTLAHAIENLLSLVRNKKIQPNSDLVDLLLEGVDALKKAFKDLNHCDSLDYSEIHGKINQLLAKVDSNSAHKIDPPIASESISNIAQKTCGFKRILIIEDDLINQKFLEGAIKSFVSNAKIVTVDSASKGIYYFFTEDFDLIFLDIMMPNIDGNTFIAIIEENLQAGLLSKRPNIVVQTAIKSIDSLSILAQNECVQEILRKPIQMDRIGDTLYRWCYS